MKNIKHLLIATVTCIIFFSSCSSGEANQKYSDFVYSGERLHKFIDDFSKLTDGADFFSLEYADENKVMFRNYAYLVIILKENDIWKIESAIDLKSLNLGNTQGDEYTQVHVTDKGNTVNIQNLSADNSLSPLYIYDTKQYVLMKKENTQILPFEDNRIYVLDFNTIFKTSDGHKFKFLNGEKHLAVTVLNQDDSIKKEIELVSWSNDIGYVGNETIVQIAYPVETNSEIGFAGNCRIIFYNMVTGEKNETLLKDLLD